VARRRGTEPPAVAGGGGGAPVRERVWGPAVQLWCEAEKVMGELVWQCGGGAARPRAGSGSSELGWGRRALWASGGAFIGARGRIVAWAQAAGRGTTRGPIPGAGLPCCRR
jgi:hypothetical protein